MAWAPAFTVLLTSVLVLTSMPIGSAQATGQPLKFGTSNGATDILLQEGLPVTYGSFWAGAWNTKSGWGYARDQVREARADGLVPVVNWWYWGDDISPDCVEKGCWSSLHNVWKDKATWYRMSRELADVMAGGPAIVVLENEFNKNGIGTYEAFDGYLAEHAAIFRAKGVKVVVGFGFWGESDWHRYDRAVAASDYAGTMMLRSSVRHASVYDRSADDLLAAAQRLQSIFKKRVLLYDFALSSYPEPEYERKQEAQIQRLFKLMPDFRAAGVEGILFRHIRDNPDFDTRNYNGQAERWWGLKHWDGSNKLAWNDFVNGLRAEAQATAPPPVSPPPSGPVDIAAGASHDLKVNAAKTGWYRLDLASSGGSLLLAVDGVATRVMPSGAASALLSLSAGEHTLRLTASKASKLTAHSLHEAAAPSAPALPGAREGESFATRTVGGLYQASAASGGAGWLIWSNGHVEHTFRSDAARPVVVTILAAGDLAGSEAPRMVLSMNGMEMAAWWVDSPEHRAYSKTLTLPAGEVSLRVAFANDYYQPPRDRNLRVDAVRVEAPAVWSAEAEKFPTRTVGAAYSDRAASGGAGWNLWTNGWVESSFSSGAGPHTVQVVAKGDYSRGWPIMRVWIDGKLAGQHTVSSAQYATYATDADLSSGTHKVRVEYINDRYAPPQDRNLRLDAVTVRPS